MDIVNLLHVDSTQKGINLRIIFLVGHGYICVATATLVGKFQRCPFLIGGLKWDFGQFRMKDLVLPMEEECCFLSSLSKIFFFQLDQVLPKGFWGPVIMFIYVVNVLTYF